MSLASVSTCNCRCRDPKLLTQLHEEIDADIQLEPQDYDPDDNSYQDWVEHQFEQLSCYDDDDYDDFDDFDDSWDHYNDSRDDLMDDWWHNGL
jgi:hypothetical protein